MTATALPSEHVTPSAQVEAITPDMAEAWLKANTRNRRLRQEVVNAYAADMAAGRWQFTGETVKFDRGGNLSDGQHRLAAIAQSGATVPMLVIRGLDPDAQHVMDTGAKRTAGDALALDGVKNTTTVAAGARLALLWSSGRLESTHKMTVSTCRWPRGRAW